MENPSGSTRIPSKLEQTQQQVNEVVGIMRVNVEKVLERDQNLTELDARADALQAGGKRFEQQAQKLKRKYWWKNIKMMIIIGIIAVVLLTIIIITIAKGSGGDSDSDSPSTATNENMKVKAIDAATPPH
ncbi:vesicle-associated membrane protein 3-like [Euwallacea similis]|uniref:vesicle-associated membrane protein 3-like n=1 Tax=Euwallacea similis TaxID=1736056 RepID=UPI00344CCBA4